MAGQDRPIARDDGLIGQLAQSALSRWPVPPDATVRLINLSENHTFLVEASDGFRAVLRVHRAGYHCRAAISSELAWMDALQRDHIVETPRYIAGHDGAAIQEAGLDGHLSPRFLVLFRFIPGHAPEADAALGPAFLRLGEIAARLHRHAVLWPRPIGFQRPLWDEAAVFGRSPIWGNWRDAPNVDLAIRRVLEQAETAVCARLSCFGKEPERFGLIHADMRLANLLVDADATRVIDFDDCGFGWFLYDFAAAISFFETDPRIPELKSAWLQGYRRVQSLSCAEEAEIDTFIMLRRLALLAWIGSHADAPEPQALAPHFASGTAELAESWLRRFRG
ncbi:MAG: phosphotransferase enzyme family protein [Roseinatronobacter sp.]